MHLYLIIHMCIQNMPFDISGMPWPTNDITLVTAPLQGVGLKEMGAGIIDLPPIVQQISSNFWSHRRVPASQLKQANIRE